MCTLINNFYANFHINYITFKIFIAFFLLICLQVIVFEKSTILKFIYRYRLFEGKNKNNLVKTDLLLFAANFVISYLSALLSY